MTVLLLGCGIAEIPLSKYIYQLHKWKASAPVCLQKLRTCFVFQQLVQLFFGCFWGVGRIARRYLCDIYDWSTAHSSTQLFQLS